MQSRRQIALTLFYLLSDCIALAINPKYHNKTLHIPILLPHSHSIIHTDADSTWLIQDATFEKMGALMAENEGRLLGLFDELSAFLTKIRLYNSRGLTDSHELAMFLELYNANPWTRATGLSLLKVVFQESLGYATTHLLSQ